MYRTVNEEGKHSSAAIGPTPTSGCLRGRPDGSPFLAFPGGIPGGIFPFRFPTLEIYL